MTPAFPMALLLLTAISAVDYYVPHEIRFTFLYMIPVAAMAWFSPRRRVHLVSALCLAAWAFAEFHAPPDQAVWAIRVWNTAVRFGALMLILGLMQVIIRFRHLALKEHEVAHRQHMLLAQEKELSQFKSDMISFVSHEIGNSLSILKMSLTLLEDSEGKAPAEERRKGYAHRESYYRTLDRVYVSMKQAAANFLNANRVEQGELQFVVENVDVNNLVQDTLSTARLLIADKDISIRVEIPPSLCVRCDPEAFSLVLNNLIGNALKYTPSGGAVTVRAFAENGRAAISVEDTGIGISIPDQRRILSGFFRTDAGMRTAKGYGIGLKISNVLLEKQGSRLYIDSAPGKGTRMYFSLPLVQPSPAAADLQPVG